MGTTLKLLLPYPEPTAPVANGANDIRGLADAIDPKLWATAWGQVAIATNAATVTTAGGTESVLMFCPAFNAPGTRRYRITIDLTGTGTTVGDVVRFTVRRGATIAGTGVKTGPAQAIVIANLGTPTVIVAYDTPPANAAQQYMAGVARLVGAGTYTLVAGSSYGNNISVEDIGPA